MLRLQAERVKHKAIWYGLALFLVFAFVAPALSWLIRGAYVHTGSVADLLVVYDDRVGEKSAKLLATLLEQSMNVKVDIVPADKYPVKFRAYPVVVLSQTADLEKLRRQNILNILVRGPDGVPMLPYNYVFVALYQYNMRSNTSIRIHYLESGTAYLVDGYSPTSRVKQAILGLVMGRYLAYLSALFGVNITSLVVINATTLEKQLGIDPLQIGVLPAIVVKVDTSANLTLGSIALRELKPGLYTLDVQSLRAFDESLAGSGLIDSYEVALQPPSTTGLIAIGSPTAPVKAIVYWDYLCPYSARFALESLKSLVRLAKEGRVQLLFADLIVHQDAVRLHRLAHCVYTRYGADAFINYSLRVFNETIRIGANQTLLESLIRELEADYGLFNCTAQLSAGFASELGVQGTPTLVFWRSGWPWLEFVVGARPMFVYEQIIDWLASKT